MKNILFDKYAKLMVKTGINLQKHQTLVITSPIECAWFTRIVAETAYKEGAREVVVQWVDELLNKIKFMNAPEEVFDEFPEWRKEFYLSNLHKGAAFLFISAEDPELMSDVDPERIARNSKAVGTALKEYRESAMNNRHVWSIVSIPTKSWAKKVYPDATDEEAVDKLWEAIFKVVRADKDDPVAEWEKHKSQLKVRMDYLNSKQFKYMHFKNSYGTDLKLELPQDHVWFGGADYTPEGREFMANMPTEEIYTAPVKTGVNGKVVSSLPLNLNGTLVEDFSLTFKDGKVVEFTAEKGYESLKRLIERDDGSCYLGEVALVPYDSPISNLKTIFYNTLYDENAACHLALGNAYPICIKDGEKLDGEELKKRGLNSSIAHEDFMIGTADLDIMAVTHNGEEVPVFIKGNFAF